MKGFSVWELLLIVFFTIVVLAYFKVDPVQIMSDIMNFLPKP